MKTTIKFRRITIENGLSHNSVRPILQDQTGFMWIGTRYGLNRYDGVSVEVYKHESDNPNSLSDNHIRSMILDPVGVLWIGTENDGLNRFDPATHTFTRYHHKPEQANSLSGPNVFCLCQDQSGIIWIGTLKSGLDRFDPVTETFTHYPYNLGNSLTSEPCRPAVICEDRSGLLWIGTEPAGLFRFDPQTEQFKYYPYALDHHNPLSHNEITSIFEDSRDNLWLGSKYGLSKFDRATEQFIHYQHDPGNPLSSIRSVWSIYEDRSKILWIGTGQGIYLFDRVGNHFTHYQHNMADRYSLSHNGVHSIYEDAGGVVWIGTDGGVNTFFREQRQFTHYKHDMLRPGSRDNNHIMAIYEDSEGILWLGDTEGHLGKFNLKSGEFKLYQHDPTNPHSLSNGRVIYAIYEDQQGELWVGGSNGGLNRFNRATEQFRHYWHNPADPNSLGGNYVLAIHEDRSGFLWIGGSGLSRFDRATEKFTNYQYKPNNPDSLSDNRVNKIYEDRSGTLWLATWNGGLNKFNRQTGKFTSYRYDPYEVQTISSDGVNALYEDLAGNLWIGTANGLCKFNQTTETFTRYFEKDGLPNNVVTGILGDEQGNLWLSTYQGLSKFDPEADMFRNYDMFDGLQSNIFTVACHKGKSGEMFFGGENGFNAFYPENIKNSSTAPRIAITNFLLFNKPVPIGGNSPLQKAIWATESITLSPNEYVFAFEFAVLSYVAPEKHRYKFKLEGFDKDWNLVGNTRRFANYNSLSGGEYTFRVIGSDSAGVWNEQGVEIKIIVQSPIWEQLRVEKETAELARRIAEEANKTKSAFLANMSHELRTPLNAILGYTQIFKRDQALMESFGQPVETIHRSGEHLLAMINDILDLSKIEAGKVELELANFHLPDFLKMLVEMVRVRAEAKGISFIYEAPANLPMIVEADEKRLRQILLNLLGNAIKFTEQGSVTLRVIVKGQESGTAAPVLIPVRFEIEDTGIGISPEALDEIFLPFHQVGQQRFRQKGTGLGLAISQNLVRLMGGELEVTSALNQGSTFWFDLGLPLATGEVEMGAKSPQSIIGFRGDKYKILVIDDVSENIEMLRAALLPLGFEIAEAIDGQQALSIITEFSPDLILLDVVMPGMSGFEFVHHMRQIPDLHEVAVIALSASADGQTQGEILAAGCDDFLPKPIQIDKLLECLQPHLALEWIYTEASAPKPEAARLVFPPQPALEALLKLARMRNITGLREQLDRLKANDVKFEPFISKIEQFVQRYQFGQLADFIAPYVEEAD